MIQHDQTDMLWRWYSLNKVEAAIDHEITLKILKFILNLKEKVKPGFLLSSMCMFPELNGQNPNLAVFTSKIQVFRRPEWTKERISWK